MKLNLSNDLISKLALEVGTPTMDLSVDTNKVLDVIAAQGADVLSRKDVTAVLFEVGALPESKLPEDVKPEKKWPAVFSTVLSNKGKGPWDIIGRVIVSRTEPVAGERGVYKFKVVKAETPVVAETETPVAAETETPVAEQAKNREPVTAPFDERPVEFIKVDEEPAAPAAKHETEREPATLSPEFAAKLAKVGVGKNGRPVRK